MQSEPATKLPGLNDGFIIEGLTMKHTKTVQIPACEERVYDKVTCDLCKSELVTRGGNTDKIEIRRETRRISQHGDQLGEIRLDICSICFDQKMVPWLKSQGVVASTDVLEM